MLKKPALISLAARKPVAFVATVSIIIVLAAWSYHGRQLTRIQAQQDAHNVLLLNIAENGVRAHVRDALYHPVHLEDWFTGLVVAANLGGLRLAGPGGLDIVRVGPYYWDEGDVVRDRYVEKQRSADRLEPLARPNWRRGGPRGQGMGGGGWHPLPPGPYLFSLAIDPAPWVQQSGTARNHTVLGTGLAIACVMLVSLLLVLREKHEALQQTLRSAEVAAARQELLARLGAGLAHETRNPLGLIRGMAQRIEESCQQDTETVRRAGCIVDEADRVAGQIDSFLSLAKPMETRIAPVALNALFEQIKALVQEEAAALNIRLAVAPTDLTVMADAGLLRRALLNLILNAFKATMKGGDVELRAEMQDRGDVDIIVQDTGCGISAEDLPYVVEPYYSRFEEGTGLGLSLTDEIARKLGSRLVLESEPGEGTIARISGLAALGKEV